MGPIYTNEKSLLLQKIECLPFEHPNFKSFLEGGAAIVQFELPLKTRSFSYLELGQDFGLRAKRNECNFIQQQQN